MKKIYVQLHFLIVLFLFGCKEKKINNTIPTETDTENKVVFKIDERTEFFRTIFNIAVQDDLSEDIRPCHTAYLKRVNAQFLPFKEHPIINWIYEDETIGIDFSAVGLMFNDLKQFEFNSIYNKELQSIGLSKETLDSITPFMIDFYQKSNFNKFFNDNKSYYAKALSKIQKQVSEEKIFDKVMHFYQQNGTGLELHVFVELTNNANNRATSFYDKYNSKKRAYILGNICEMPEKSNMGNEFLELNNDIRGILYHETSHLFTDKLLNKHIGDLAQYKVICSDCSDIQIMDKVDHMIVGPIQAIMMKKFDQNNAGNDFFLERCKDIRKEVYKRLFEYDPKGDIPFEKVYIDCINLIKNSTKKGNQ